MIILIYLKYILLELECHFINSQDIYISEGLWIQFLAQHSIFDKN